jgi:hypothetical protein
MVERMDDGIEISLEVVVWRRVARAMVGRGAAWFDWLPEFAAQSWPKHFKVRVTNRYRWVFSQGGLPLRGRRSGRRAVVQRRQSPKPRPGGTPQQKRRLPREAALLVFVRS